MHLCTRHGLRTRTYGMTSKINCFEQTNCPKPEFSLVFSKFSNGLAIFIAGTSTDFIPWFHGFPMAWTPQVSYHSTEPPRPPPPRPGFAAFSGPAHRLEWRLGPFLGTTFFWRKKNQGGNPRFLVIVFFFKVKLLKRQSLFRENANFSMGLLGIWVSTDRARREKWRARCNL